MSGTITDVPIVLTAAGRTNTAPSVINEAIIAGATALSPGLTILPSGLIEDISSTDTGSVVIIDQAVTETIQSLTPYAANNYTLLELGQIYLGQGSTSAPASNTSAYLIFSSSQPGFPIQPGFTVSDGVYQYTVRDGGVIGAGNVSQLIFVQATQQGTWAVPANSITTIVTSVPVGISLTVTNPLAGTPGGLPQSAGDYRAQVLQAGLAMTTGTPNKLRTALQLVPGVTASLVSIRQVAGAPPGWEIIVGGTGDPYQIGDAIYRSLFDLNTLVGSTMAVTAITNANPGQVTTSLNHGFVTGQVINISGALGISGVNNTPLTITYVDQKNFTIGVNTTSSGTWTSGGVITPNFRNFTVTISDYPDSYTIPFVIPPVQAVTMVVTWNTSSLNFVSPTSVANAIAPALAAYINALPIGAPINVLELNDTFANAVASIIPENLITRLVFAVSINGVSTAVNSGTQIIVGDPESYFSMAANGVVSIQG